MKAPYEHFADATTTQSHHGALKQCVADALRARCRQNRKSQLRLAPDDCNMNDTEYVLRVVGYGVYLIALKINAVNVVENGAVILC